MLYFDLCFSYYLALHKVFKYTFFHLSNELDRYDTLPTPKT